MARSTEPGDHLPLHQQDFQILLSLVAGPSYGTRMVREIEELHDGRTTFFPANLFRRIRNLLDRGLVEEREPPAGADPRRTYLGLTGLGRAVVTMEARRMEALVRDARALELLQERSR